MRAKRTRFNSVKSDIIVLDGGLNENVSSLELKPGEMIKCLNYQHVLGSQGGYKSIAGYERYDGQTKPSSFGPDESEVQRAKINAVPGTGRIRGITVFEGTVYAFRDDVTTTRCRMWRATNRGWQEVDTTNSQLAPGGDFRFFKYNFFGGVSGTSPSSSPSSSASGTNTVSDSPSGSPSAGTPSGSPSDSGSATPSEETPSASPSEGTPSSSESGSATPSEGTASSSPSGTGAVSPSDGTPSASPSAGTPSGTPSGSPSEGTGSSTPSDSPSASPSASASASPAPDILSINLFFVDGVNQCHRFDGKNIYPISTGNSSDNPTHVVVHNERLFLAFSGGSLQYSAAGEPGNWGLTAGEMGIGREITNLVTGVGNALVIFCDNNIKILQGNSPDDWILETYSTESGAYEMTPKRLLGTIFFMDDRGVTELSAVDAFGDFEANSISEKVYNTVQENKSLVTCATVSRDLNQYRLFFSNGYGLYFCFQDKKLRGTTLVKFDDPVYYVAEGEDSDGNNIILFSSGTNGIVYQMDSGTSFDGQPIETRFSTAYWHFKSPRAWKKFQTASFEIASPQDMNITIVPDFDYGSQTAPRGTSFIESLSGTGEEWGEETWGSLQWEAGNEETNSLLYYIMGMGRNMNFSFRTESRLNPQHTVQNILVEYELIGRQH